MNNQLISLAIALPTLLLTITPTLADTTNKNQIRVNSSQQVQSKPIRQGNGIIRRDLDPGKIPDLHGKRERPGCFWIFCGPPAPKEIRNPRILPTKVKDLKTIPPSIPVDKLR